MSNINTSMAQRVTVDIFDIDNLPMSLTYTDKSTNLPIDITNYGFEFILNFGSKTLTSYSLVAGSMSNVFLSKTDTNVLNMSKMFEDIRKKIQVGKQYSLIQVVTDIDLQIFVHIIYTINVSRY